MRVLEQTFLQFSSSDGLATIVGKFALLIGLVFLIISIISGLAYLICFLLYRTWDLQNADYYQEDKCEGCLADGDNLKCVFVQELDMQSKPETEPTSPRVCSKCLEAENYNNMPRSSASEPMPRRNNNSFPVMSPMHFKLSERGRSTRDVVS